MLRIGTKEMKLLNYIEADSFLPNMDKWDVIQNYSVLLL